MYNPVWPQSWCQPPNQAAFSHRSESVVCQRWVCVGVGFLYYRRVVVCGCVHQKVVRELFFFFF